LFYFLPITLAGYYLLPKVWHKNIILFIASLVFFFWCAGSLVLLLPAVGLSAWLYSLLIAKSRFKGIFLITAIVTFLGVLFYYKYLGFFIDNLIYSGIAGIPKINPMAPLGLSFFTFQAISYNIDVYRDNKTFEKNPAYVLIYISMFPQLISGPLVRYDKIEQQLKHRSFDITGFAEGIRRFIIGLGKKVLIANPLSFVVAQIMSAESGMIGPAVAWAGIIAFTVQIFFDFSGYTDMAIGVGKMLGFDLPENFNFPYYSRSITEFWRRWHMTLSAWLRDYLFTPLSVSMRNIRKAGLFISLMITFTLCGIWHGPSWTFIIWGAFHGFFLGIEALFLGKILKKIKVAALFYTLLVIMISWVFFRTESIGQSFSYLKTMFTPANSGALGLESFFAKEHIAILLIGICLCFPISLPAKFKTGKTFQVLRIIGTVLLVILFMLSLMRVVTETFNPFIYFRF
jgi:alginate O-acetyltransferase complex protein AlgI